jgi:hypothetical protein
MQSLKGGYPDRRASRCGIGPERGSSTERKGTVETDGSTTSDDYIIDLSLSKESIRDPMRPHAVPSPHNFTEGMLLKGGRISRTLDLAPGAQKEYSASVEIPKTKFRKYWIGVSPDPFNKVAEGPPTGESDNAVNQGITIKRAMH